MMADRKSLGFILLALIQLSSHINCQTTSLSRASFGEACDKGLRCDSRASLSCGSENVCQCVKPDEMKYDKNRGKCVVLSGERCSYTAVEILMDQTQEKRWTEKLDCVANAVCNNDGYCDCRSEFYEHPEGTCVPKGMHGQNCTKDEECRTDKQLVCTNQLCSCNQTEAVFDPAYNQCVARAGASCLKYERCVRNADCPRRHRYHSYNRDALYDICTCSSEYKRSNNGLCLAKYGMTCDVKSAPCSQEFSCINGKCDCHFPDHQTYNSNSLQCVSYVRGPCSEQINGLSLQFPCVPNAKCLNHDNLLECSCEDGYIESENRRCSIAHGQSCGDRTTETCDKIAELKCRNGICSCSDFQIYDLKLAKCRGLVGAACAVNATYSFCVDGASCHSFRDVRTGYGVCRCVPPAVPDLQRYCTSLTLIEENDSNNVINGTVESVEEVIVLEDTTTDAIA